MRDAMLSPLCRWIMFLSFKALQSFLGQVELVSDRWASILLRLVRLPIYAFGRFDYFSWSNYLLIYIRCSHIVIA